MKLPNQPILLVEDDLVDVLTVGRALQELRVPNPVVTAQYGEAARRWLHDAASQPPCIVLLDLNMPVMNGIEFLRHMKADDVLRRIPVVVLTTSGEQRDKTCSFDLGVAGYMAKPVDYRRFVATVRSIDECWTASEMP